MRARRSEQWLGGPGLSTRRTGYELVCGDDSVAVSLCMFHRGKLDISTRGRGTYDITAQVSEVVRQSGARDGLATVFVHHTSASVIVCENADPSVRRDLEAFVARLVPDGDRLFTHVAEGDDDMPAHVRTVLTQTSIGIPIEGGALALGTWQGLYLWEHRTSPHRRQITVAVVGA